MTVTETVTVGIVLVIPIQALFPHHHPHHKGLDAPLMAPMTSRTGPKGRSETTFVAVTEWIVLVMMIQASTPTTRPQRQSGLHVL